MTQQTRFDCGEGISPEEAHRVKRAVADALGDAWACEEVFFDEVIDGDGEWVDGVYASVWPTVGDPGDVTAARLMRLQDLTHASAVSAGADGGSVMSISVSIPLPAWKAWVGEGS